MGWRAPAYPRLAWRLGRAPYLFRRHRLNAVPIAGAIGRPACPGYPGVAVFGRLFLSRDRLPYSALLDGLSNISYPLYLLHGVNGYVMMRAIFVVKASYYLALAAAVAVALGLATVVHVFVETPTNEFGRRLGRRLSRRAPTPGAEVEVEVPATVTALLRPETPAVT